jgi:uncharacterized protein (TIGR00251 family)
MIEVRESGTNLLFSVKVQPKASANRAAGEHGGALKVAVTAPPEKGKANAAVIALLSKVLGVPKSSIEIIRGDASRTKTLSIRGRTKAELTELLELALETGGKRGS